MKEELLHFIWQSKLLLGKPLHTVHGESITLIQLGTYNANSGPDFFNAKIKIGETLWAGNVEIHIRSSDWDAHKHQHDAAYNNVILHVVYVHDKEVRSAAGNNLPTVELRNFIPTSLLQRYVSLQHQQAKHIPCEKILVVPSAPVLTNWLQRLLVERIERKSDYIKELLLQTQYHYEHCFYIITARYLGMKTNAQPFEQLAKQLPLSVISRHKHNWEDVLALVLGISGLLPHMEELYHPLILRFEHLQNKYKLITLDKSIWKFSRTRPSNFPTVRLVQFANLLYQSSHLLGAVLECNNMTTLTKLYRKSMYWKGQKIQIGVSAAQLLLLNSVLPFVFVYGKQQHREDLCEKTLDWYEQLPVEENTITRLFHSLGLASKNAADSQAYIQLKNEYCSTLNCLKCSIGHQSLLHA
jgi:hypothetical protein